MWSISQERLAPNASPQRILNGTERLYTLNRELIGADPDLIFVGQELLLPPAMSSGRHTGATPAHGTAGKTTGAAEAAEAGPRDRTAKGRTGSKATGKAPRTVAGGADAKVGNVPEREAEPMSLPDEAVAAPVPAVRTVASIGTRAEGRWVQALGVWLLTLVVLALMAWKLPMRRTIRADAERWGYQRGSTTGRRRLTATTPPSRPARALPEARDREGARGERIPQPPGPKQ